jgi:hypothetical protein
LESLEEPIFAMLNYQKVKMLTPSLTSPFSRITITYDISIDYLIRRCI